MYFTKCAIDASLCFALMLGWIVLGHMSGKAVCDAEPTARVVLPADDLIGDLIRSLPPEPVMADRT